MCFVPVQVYKVIVRLTSQFINGISSVLQKLNYTKALLHQYHEHHLFISLM